MSTVLSCLSGYVTEWLQIGQFVLSLASAQPAIALAVRGGYAARRNNHFLSPLQAVLRKSSNLSRDHEREWIAKNSVALGVCHTVDNIECSLDTVSVLYVLAIR